MNLADVLAGTRAWIVGGTVRDELLGRSVKDVDIALEGDPQPAARRLAAAVRGPVFPLSEAFGAWRVIDRRAGLTYDLSPLQGETIEADLAQRDFSVNAMAGLEPAAPDAGLLDPTGGLADIERRLLRVLGAGAYAADPLRALRLPRLAAELGFEPDAETERLTRAAAARVTEAAPERIFAELKRLLIAPGVLDGRRARRPPRPAERGAARAGRPARRRAEPLPPPRRLRPHARGARPRDRGRGRSASGTSASWPRRVRAELDQPLADELTRGQALRFGALLHDVGKPATRGVRPDGRVTFMGHDAHGEEMVRVLCRRLRASEKLARFVEALTRQHLVLGFLVHERPLDARHGLPLPQAHDAGGGRGHPAQLRRPPGHARPQGRRGDRRAPRARARADGGRTRLARAGAAAAAGARATSWRGRSSSRPAPSSAGCSRAWRRRPTPARRAPADEAVRARPAPAP